MRADDLLSLLDAVHPRGPGKWSARCTAHTDRSPSLTISEGDKGLLLKCWAGCSLAEICASLGILVADLFYDTLPTNSEQRRAVALQRAHARAARQAHFESEGRRCDALRDAEALIRSARAISIDGWSDAALQCELTRLGNAYALLDKEGRCE